MHMLVCCARQNTVTPCESVHSTPNFSWCDSHPMVRQLCGVLHVHTTVFRVIYGKCANSGTNLVALCCIRSSLSMFLTKYEFQIETQYSKCGRM